MTLCNDYRVTRLYLSAALGMLHAAG